MAKKISELRKRMSAESRARAEAKAKAMLAKMPSDKVTEPREQEKWLSERKS